MCQGCSQLAAGKLRDVVEEKATASSAAPEAAAAVNPPGPGAGRNGAGRQGSSRAYRRQGRAPGRGRAAANQAAAGTALAADMHDGAEEDLWAAANGQEAEEAADMQDGHYHLQVLRPPHDCIQHEN